MTGLSSEDVSPYFKRDLLTLLPGRYRNAEMIIKVYSRYIQNVRGSEDGAAVNGLYKGIEG
jgi:hypothetical protein